MRTLNIYSLIFILLFTISASAQNSAPKLPSRVACEACANKKAPTLLEKYGTAENFIGCLVAGGTSAQMVQIDNLLKTAQVKKENFTLKSSSPAVRFMILRNIRSYVNLVDYGADFALKFPFEKEYIKTSMEKFFNAQKAKAQELRNWVDRMQAILDKEHPDIKKGMDNAIGKLKTGCEVTWHKAKNGLIYPETLFFDREKSNQFVVGCAEVNMNFYDLLRTPAPKIYASTKRKRTPYCSGETTLNDWNIFWTNRYFILKPKLYDTQKLLSNDLRIEYFDKTGQYQLAFNYDSGNFSDNHIQLIYIDGALFHEGKWTIERYADGKLKSVKDPAINQNIIDIFKLGSEVEIKVIGKELVKDASTATGFKSKMLLQASARFSLKDFTRALSIANTGKVLKSVENKEGKCKE